MDRIIEKKKWPAKRILLVAGVAAIVCLIAASIYATSGNRKLNVEAGRITISEVKQGPFREFIPVNGVVQPLTSIYLDAAEGGRVEEKYTEDGAFMKKGQPILRLSNTDLQLSLVQQETQVYNLITQMQIAKNASQQNRITNLNQMTDVDNQLKEAERIYNLNKNLYAKKAIGSQELKQSENAYNYQLEKKKLATQTISQDAQSSKQQLAQAEQSYKGSQNALTVMRQKVGDLIVRAPVDGQLTSLDAEVGQNKNKGERLGQLDVMGDYKVRVDIDEHYISRIYNDLEGIATIADKDYVLTIKKVYTQVTNGRFQVDMAFESKAPEGIRRGQTLQIRLALSDETKALLLPRGGFYNKTGGRWVYKLDKDGKLAYKTDVELGRQNPDYFEVLNGLKPGDKVVTSSYDNYGDDMQELVIKAP
ncbi:MAG: efflux RND transporter periplasmic adaptor subunit [Niabella sp.]